MGAYIPVEPQRGGLTHGAVGPVVVGLGPVAQHPQEDGDRLGVADGPGGGEGAVAHAEDEAGAADLGGHREVYVAPGPVAGGHVGEYGPGLMGRDLGALAHGEYYHFAKFRPCQRALGPEQAVADAVEDAHCPQGLNGLADAGVINVGEGGYLPRSHGKGPKKPGHDAKGQHNSDRFF